MNTTVVCIAGLAVLGYLVHLVITKKGDFEARARAGTSEFVLKAKERKK